MSFSTFKVILAPSTVGTGLSASLRKPKNGPARLTLTLSVSAAAEVDWEEGAGIEVQLGEGEHHGLLRLRKNASVTTTIVKRRNGTNRLSYFAIALGHIPALVNRSEKKRWCRFEQVAEGSWVEITLPSWADETAPDSSPLRNRAPPPAPLRIAPPTQSGARVTSRLMGDPSPQRSALADRPPARGGKK